MRRLEKPQLYVVKCWYFGQNGRKKKFEIIFWQSKIVPNAVKKSLHM